MTRQPDDVPGSRRYIRAFGVCFWRRDRKEARFRGTTRPSCAMLHNAPYVKVKESFCLSLPPSDDLVDSLFRNTESLSEASSGFSRFMPCNNFGVAFSFFRRMVSLWHLREWRIVEHLHDVKRRQPNIEASCGFEPPMGHYGAQLASPLEVELGYSRKSSPPWHSEDHSNKT
jgi:hypothetical protein